MCHLKVDLELRNNLNAKKYNIFHCRLHTSAQIPCSWKAFLNPQQSEATSALYRSASLAFSQDLVIILAFSSSVIVKQATVTDT